MDADLPATSPNPEELHRMFYAIRLAEPVNRYLAEIMAELRAHGASVSWVPEANLHITLRFLGDITISQLEEARALPGAEAGHPGFDLRAEGLGAFPLLRAPRIFWAGVAGGMQQDTDRLLHLQGRTEQWARKLGIPAENRRYTPHITLGRVHPPLAALRELTNDVIGRTCHSATCHVDELLLLRSTLTPKGSIYEVEGRWGME